ncbi:hypothetical protein C4B63_32g20 [Trypanosoma cruzi]|uniref:Uncharacterized protein n=1 Tax=Trypanosoma cruzi TaxID=5693 RepID=A0A2V2V9N6_TRYCR|nr:hypothetical protein C4B63_32g20 [Trypanosoma cruzi]
MEEPKNEVTLGVRLATRYVPNQVLPSTLSWGFFMGVEDFMRLERCFAERSITHDGDPAITKEWLVHYMMLFLGDHLNLPASGVETEEATVCGVQLLDDEKMQVYKEEVLRWASSFSIGVSVHDPLWDACEVSNAELARTEHSMSSSTYASSFNKGASSSNKSGGYSATTTASSHEGAPRGGRLGRTRSVVRMLLRYNRPAGHAQTQRKGQARHEIVRWSDLTTNLVRDYERFHQVDEKELSFTRVRTELTSGNSSLLRSVAGKEGLDTDWSRVTEGRGDTETDVFTGSELHAQSADHILVSTVMDCVVTASKDGVVKLWNGKTGIFMRNLYNAGNAWVIGMFLLHDEEYILIATTKSQLTVLDFPEGNVLQKYVGCISLQTALYEVVQLSANNIQRYGMKPGECGRHRVELRKDETAEHYHARRRESQNCVFSKVLPAKPVVGFDAPTASWFDKYSGIFFFGTATGAVGAFDISADVRPSALLAGANSKPVCLLFLTEVHAGAVVGVFYTSYVTSVFTAGADGCIYRTPLGPTGKPSGESRLVAQQARAIRSMQWWPPSKFYVTIHVDRRVVLWVIGRYGDPLHQFPSETQEVVSATLHPRRQRLAVLLSDKTIKVYETHGNKSLATIAQPTPDSNFTATDATRQMMERSAVDEDGVVAWHPYNSSIICCLRATVVYEPSKNQLQTESVGETEINFPEDERGTFSNRDVRDIAEDVKPKPRNLSAVGVVESRRVESHRSGVVAMAVQRQALRLHTFDEEGWRMWDLDTGAIIRQVNVPRVARMEHMPLKRATVASCSWTTSLQVRLVTGGQDASILTWDPVTCLPLAAEMLVHDVSEQLDSDVNLMSHRNKLIAWSARLCRVTTFNTGSILPSGIEESKSVLLRVPSLASITACCVVRDAYLCVGTGDARIFFFSLRGGAPTHDCVLREKTEEGKGAVVHLIFLNEQNQNLLLVIIDIGILFVYSYVKQAVVYRICLGRRFECRIRKALYIPEDGTVVYGDSLGRIRVVDVRGCTSLSVEFRQAFILKSTFQGATDEITSLESFYSSGRRYLLVGSLDRMARLFYFDDTDWLHAPFSNVAMQQNTMASVRFVGAFGRDTWRLSDPTTFSEEPPTALRVPANNTAEEEMLLENILHPETRPESVRSLMDSLLDDDFSVSRARSRRGTKVITPLSASGSPRGMLTRPFFLTDISHPQEEVTQVPSLSFLSSTEGARQSPMAQATQSRHEQQGPSIPSGDEEGGAPSTSQGIDRVSSMAPTTGRRPQFCPRPGENFSKRCSVSLFTGPPPQLPSLDRQTEGPSEGGNPYQGFLAGSLSPPKKRMALLTMTRRLEAVLPRKFANGELFKNANELLMADAQLGLRRTKSGRTRQEKVDLQQALENRRQLAERVEEYKKKQEKRRCDKRNTLMPFAARHELIPVVFPQPSVLSNEGNFSFAWMLNASAMELPQKPFAHASNTM